MTIVRELLEAGRRADFESIGRLRGAGEHRAVVHLSADLRSAEVLHTIQSWPIEDRVAFAKAIAVYEHTVGGIGSVTALDPLLRIIPKEAEEETTDWILANTSSYAYYSRGARSYRELQARAQEASRARAELRASNAERERTRAEDAKQRRAERATANLPKAVRRGDLRAVRSMLRNGAVVDQALPDGTPLIAFAEQLGRSEIAALLRAHAS